MYRYFRAIDPGRSLATAVAWLAVVLSLAVALALVAVGDYATNSMLAQRDAVMQRFAGEFAAEIEKAMATEARTTGSRSVLPSPARLAAAATAARQRSRADPRARVVLIETRRIVFEQPEGGAAGQIPVVDDVTLVPDAGDGPRLIAVTAPREAAPSLAALGLQVAVVQREEEWGQAGGLQEKLTAISILLSITAALVGAAFARRLTRRLGELTQQVQQVARQEADGIREPAGRDEVALLGRAFSRLLEALRTERDELDRLTRELEQRVDARTREVERLAADSRYAAVVRERLRLARDLHDTLAHSMMEMLVQVRTLRMLHAHDPEKLGAELARAEEAAHQGLQEAREAVGRMRLNAVRDLGLGPALASAANRFAERSGLEVCFSSDPKAASFADPRAETLFRIAEEALRNIARHSEARSVAITLRDLADSAIELAIVDDGVGFDPNALHPGHYGVVGIREQAQLIGAELTLCSAPGAGARVQVRLPVGPGLGSTLDPMVPESAELS